MDEGTAAAAGIAPRESAAGPAPDGAVAPHEIALALWGMPEAVPVGERFTVKVGAKSSAGCVLSGGRIEIRDSGDAVVASGCLGESPWPETGALYWADVALQAPAAPGRLALTAQCNAAEIEPPHRGASSRFNVTIVERPEHTLTVMVIAKATGVPIEEAQIRLGPYRATTAASGRAEVKMSKGRYQLQVWKAGYDAPVTAVDLHGDALVAVEIVAMPEQDPDAHWTG